MTTVSGVILFAAGFIGRILGARGLTAMERLTGMLLTTVAVQMFLSGLREFLGGPGGWSAGSALNRPTPLDPSPRATADC